MKKLLYLFAALLVMAACKPTNEPSLNKGKLDPTAMVKIKGVTKGAKVVTTGLTPLQVVEQATGIDFQSHWFDNRYYDKIQFLSRGIGEGYRDFETPAILMFGTDIVTQEGELYKDFLYGFEVYIVRADGDTIAHIPNGVLEAARPLIEAAYNDSNYTEVYRLFDKAYTFQPL